MASRVTVFSYGSNGTAQLRARVQNPELRSRPAYVENYVRIFCLESFGWGGGAVASLHPVPSGGKTWGAVVDLTEHELSLLDRFEGGYSKQNIQATVCTADGREEHVEAVAYIADDSTFREPPTEQYLVAIHLMLREHWDMSEETIEVRSVEEQTGGVRIESSWRHPGCTNLSLAALMVEVNARKPHPWEMPATIGSLIHKLAKVGVTDSADLAVALQSGTLNSSLEAEGCLPFHTGTLTIFTELLS